MEWSQEVRQTMSWNGAISNREAKEKVAAQLAEKVKEGDVIGLVPVPLLFWRHWPSRSG